MTDLRKAAEMALEFVEWLCGDDHSIKPKNKALDVREALRLALAQPEQEPVAWELRKGKTDRVLLEITNNSQRAHDWKASLEEVVPLYTAPPKREWVGLTGLEQKELMAMNSRYAVFETEAKLKEKNGG